MEMKNTFVELEQFEELTPEVLEEVNGGGISFVLCLGFANLGIVVQHQLKL